MKLPLIATVVFAAALTPAAVGCATDCPAALLTGVLTDQAGELVVADTSGATERVIWPFGLAVRSNGDQLVVTDWFGAVRAREGDVVRLGGGETTTSGVWTVCGMFEVVAGTESPVPTSRAAGTRPGLMPAD